MRVFISYRRSDTGGRAGRLRDALAARFGDRNVFQDVAALAPGVEFDARIGETIAGCDVVLVLIGTRWLDETDSGGVRRLDRPDDYVRHEIREALARDKRVVPVLVEAAQLPEATDLPDDIAPLVRRQAFVLRDGSWPLDVRELVGGLERDPSGSTRRPLAAYAAIGLVGIVAIAGLVAIARGVMSDGDDASDDELPVCEPADAGWVDVTPGDGGALDTVTDGEPARFEPLGARYRPDGVEWTIVVEMAVTSTAEPGTENDLYLSEAILDALLVDGVEAEDLVCVAITGDPQILPGRTAIGELGFRTPIDPRGASIQLAGDGGGIVDFGTG